MKITINGKEKIFEEETLTISEILKKESVERPEMVSVEHNGTFLERSSFDNTRVQNDDKLEFLYFMGGGAFIVS